MTPDWHHLSSLLASTSPGPWVISEEGDDVCVVDAKGGDITGLAPKQEALSDFQFIVEARNSIPGLLNTIDRYLQLLLQHRVCLDCGIKMNRQLYCVKCDTEWGLEGE